MGASATLVSSSLAVEPGSSVDCAVRIRNTGTVVDEFTVEVLGDAAAYATVDPPRVSLFPGAEGSVVVRFDPPRRPDVGPGQVPFGVRAISKEDPAGSVVEEGILDVAPFRDLAAELLPRTSRSARQGRHELAIDNRGNGRANLGFAGGDAESALALRFDPPGVAAASGTASFVKVGVSPRRRVWRGPDRTHSFEVVVEPEDGSPFSVDGMYLQQPLIPRWLPKALLALLALALLLAVLWFTLFKPTIKSAAKDAVDDKLAEALGSPPADGGGGGGGGGGDQPTPTTPLVVSVPVDGRLSLPDNGSYRVPDDKLLRLTDVILQNPAGNSGTLRMRRGDTVLLEVNLDNFRDLDYHFVAPLLFKAGDELRITVDCLSPSCTPGLSYVGFLVDT